jgi:ADP-heptose:LPS heptosyltransferase
MGRSFNISKRIDILSKLFQFGIIVFLHSVKKLFCKKKKIDKILIVKVDAVGDACLFLPIIEFLKNDNIRFDLVCSTDSVEIFKTIGGYEGIFTIDYKRFLSSSFVSFFYKLNKLKILSKVCYRSIIQTRYSRSFYVEDTIMFACIAEKKIGINGEVDFATRYFLKERYDILLQVDRNLHELNKNFVYFNRLLNKQWIPALGSINKYFTFERVIKEKYFVVFPGARDGIRHWPINYFSEVIQYVKKQYGLLPIICGSKGEIHLANKIMLGVEALDYTGKTNLVELIGLIKHSKFVMSNETASVHIAAAINIPSICITGGGHFKRFVPYPNNLNILKPPIVVNVPMGCYNCNWNCIFGYDLDTAAPCITKITTDMVVKEIDNLLTKKNE